MDPAQIGDLIGQYGFPIVSSGLLLYLVYYIWRFITDEVEPMIEEIHMTTIALIDKVRMLDNDLIRLQQKLDTVIELREAEHVKRSFDIISDSDYNSSKRK
jgi:hypothetical protein